MDQSVPSRIVLLGTSKLSLNDRFTKIVPITRSSRPLGGVTNFGGGRGFRNKRPISEQPLIVNNLEDDLLLEDEIVDEPFVPEYRVLPRRVRINKVSPITNRITFPVYRQYSYSPAATFIRKYSYMSNKPRPFGSLRYAPMNTKYNGNLVSGYNNRTKFSSKWVRGATFRGNGKTVRGRRVFVNRPKRPAVTREQLDEELEAYMKKGKHPPIDVSDLAPN